ncbi:MAG: outer membrane protein assembly factor BamA [Deltaproteobacteria bacterium]|nr:outer membrane protein assembly factor BamA [Deltaproteobacteria bacterium]
MKKTIFAAFLLLFASFDFLNSAAAQENINVVVLPFEVHSRDDISGFRIQMLEAIAGKLDETKEMKVIAGDRLKKVILEKGVGVFDEGAAKIIGRELKVDFVVLGSITKLGRRYSIDAKVFNVQQDRLSALSFIEGDDTRDLAKRASDLSFTISSEMLKEALAAGRVFAPQAGIVGKINITGNRRVDADAVTAKIKTKVGDKFDSEQIREDIKAVYDTGFFDDIVVDLADTALGKELTFIVRERPIIKQITITGNKELTEEKLKESITIKTNTTLNRIILKENAEKIKALYANEGYYVAKVEPVVNVEKDVEAQVNFQIDEGEKVRIKRITIIGNKKMAEKQIKKVMNTSEAGFFSFFTKSGVYQEYIYQNDLNLIMGQYFDNGYIQANITDSKVTLSSDKKWLYITIAVTEGEQFKIGKIDVQGDILKTKKDILENVKTKTGNVFSRKALMNDITKVGDVYGDAGYANVDINPITKLNEDKTVDLTFDIHKGEPVYIERVNIAGNINTRDKVIRREVEVEEGELYSSTGIKRSRNNLKRLGYFEDVEITTQPGSAENKMVVDVNVKERPTGSFSVGAGYSSADNFIATASVTQKNLFGTGKILDLSATVSGSSQKYNLSFTEPWLFDKPIAAGIDLFNTSKEWPDFTRRSNGFDLRLGFPVYKRDTRGYLTYKFEEVEVTNIASNASKLIKEQEGKNINSSITASVRRDTRDDAFFPTEGSTLLFSVEFAGEAIGGDVNFIKYIFEGVRYFSMPWDTAIATRGVVGFLQDYGGKEAPVYERFFLGGINTLRGFKTRSVGPRDPRTNELIGGDTEALLNVEYIFPIFPEQKVKGVLFFDTGNAWDGEFLSDLRYSAGLGFRWYSPFGPLRLEWGYNLDKKPGEGASQFEFSIGTGF